MILKHSETELHAILNTIDASSNQLITEMVKASAAGSTSRIQSYAPTLVNLSWCHDIIQDRLEKTIKASGEKNSEAGLRKVKQ